MFKAQTRPSPRVKTPLRAPSPRAASSDLVFKQTATSALGVCASLAVAHVVGRGDRPRRAAVRGGRRSIRIWLHDDRRGLNHDSRRRVAANNTDAGRPDVRAYGAVNRLNIGSSGLRRWRDCRGRSDGGAEPKRGECGNQARRGRYLTSLHDWSSIHADVARPPARPVFVKRDSSGIVPCAPRRGPRSPIGPTWQMSQ